MWAGAVKGECRRSNRRRAIEAVAAAAAGAEAAVGGQRGGGAAAARGAKSAANLRLTNSWEVFRPTRNPTRRHFQHLDGDGDGDDDHLMC